MTFVYNPCCLELFIGPMKSGKTKALIDRIDLVEYVHGVDFIFFKPLCDIREEVIRSRSLEKFYKCHCVRDPEEIFSYIKQELIIAIDEVQFFPETIVDVVKELLINDKNVLAAGLSSDFRGKTFGSVSDLVVIAHNVKKLSAICEYPGCNNLANMTQRLINGKPAPYDAPVISVEGSSVGEEYQARCLKHHFVPGKK